MGKSEGFEGIARELVAGAAAAAAADGAEAQLDLLALLPAGRQAPTEAESAAILANAMPRGRGRPLGAGNLATREVKRALVKLFGDPLLESARWLLHTPHTMARELSCSPLEAFTMQQRIREALAPFIHAKVAPVGEDGRTALPTFQLVIGGAGADLGSLAPWLADPEIAAALELEQNQALSAADAELSHGNSRTEPASD